MSVDLAATAVSGAALSDTKIKLKKWQRVFVNRSLNMGSIKAIGFDMDHTLVTYNEEAFEDLAFRKTLEKFIAAGYPQELAQLRFNPHSVIRGLLVDRERGNLLKVDGHKYVKIAFHGTHRLAKEERHRLYNAESFKAEKFLSVDTFFALSEVHLFVELVEYMRTNPGKIQKTFVEVYQDLRRFIDESHRDGSIKSEVIAHPERFVDRDRNLHESLIRMIDGGKQLFLLTNSRWDYTDVMMRYILDGQHPDYPHWQDYFHYIFVGGGKPGFFTGTQGFYEVVPESGLLRFHEGPLQKGMIYHGGSAELFQQLAGIRGDDILYVGDHIYGDIIRSKGLFNWRTMLVVPELDRELPMLEAVKDLSEAIVQDSHKREIMDEELHMLRNKVRSYEAQIQKSIERGDRKRAQHLEKEQHKLHERVMEKATELAAFEQMIKARMVERESKIHPVWGELMKVGMEKSRFARQVEQYACLYTSCVANLRFYSPFKRFSSSHEILPHDV